MPPSTNSSVPVRKLESAAAISVSVPMRPAGILG
jgi:hypothetical protein